jgi:hypothetical protein
MNDKKRSGCSALVIVLILGLLLLGLIVSSIFWFMSARVSRDRAALENHRSHAERIAFASESGDERESVKLSADSYPRYSAADLSAGLSREHFVALMADQNATELARQTFTATANGQTVRWLLKTSNVSQANDTGPILADFQLPYRIQTNPQSWTGSSLSVRAEFPPSERERLVVVRRNDWVTVEGRLELKGQEIKLLDARIPLPANAEKAER